MSLTGNFGILSTTNLLQFKIVATKNKYDLKQVKTMWVKWTKTSYGRGPWGFRFRGTWPWFWWCYRSVSHKERNSDDGSFCNLQSYHNIVDSFWIINIYNQDNTVCSLLNFRQLQSEKYCLLLAKLKISIGKIFFTLCQIIDIYNQENIVCSWPNVKYRLFRSRKKLLTAGDSGLMAGGGQTDFEISL